MNPVAVETSPPGAGARPVAAGERFASIDVVRGFALLGILAMNIPWFGLPFGSKGPAMAASMTGASYPTWVVGYLLLDGKMRSLFAMLYGAGMVLMSDRAAASGRSAARLFYRRSAILLGIGLLHGYLIWSGDILYTYALAGMVVYQARGRSPRTLVALGLAALLPALVATVGLSASLRGGEPAARSAAQVAEARDEFETTVEEADARRGEFGEGSLATIFRARAKETFFDQFILFPLVLGWDAASRMLVGMALMKLGYITGRRSGGDYARLALLGYGVGLPLVSLAIGRYVGGGFGAAGGFEGLAINEVASILVALGHLGALMLALKAGALPGLTARLAAVGRMALSNYLAQSLICTTLFYGYGFGLYGRLSRAELLLVVAAVWAFQLWLSPIWLRRFRFGPGEWVWRSLTYGRPQPLLDG